jgi:hypothetical protein
MLEEYAEHNRGLEETMQQVARIVQSQKQEGARQNQHNVPVSARNDPKQGGARQNQPMPRDELVLAENDQGNSDKRMVVGIDARLLRSLIGTNRPLVINNVVTHNNVVHNHGSSAPNEGSCKYFIKKIWKYRIPIISFVVFHPMSWKDVFESCYKLPLPGIKESMHYLRLALDDRDASHALQDCIASKKLNSSDLAGLTRCWEHVYDDFGKSARLRVVEGTPSYMNERITRAQFFNLLGGAPRTNSAALTPWTSNLTHKEICELIDENLNGTVELGEVDAAKHKKFLVVAGPQDQTYVEALRRILTNNPDTHYSKCIEWLETLPQSDRQMLKPTFLDTLASEVAMYVRNVAPYVVIGVLSAGATGATFTGAIGHAITGRLANAAIEHTWTPHINAEPVFAGHGNRLGNTENKN